MVVEGNNGPVPIVYGHKQSTVVPASVTGEVNHDLTNMDVAMKLHYLRGVYYFKKSEIIDSLTVLSMKQTMFPWLDMYYQISGRIRQPEEAGNRLFVKCNDCGVRIIEAKCKVTLDEWLRDKELLSRCKHLVPSKVLGPQLYFSPLTYVQFTKFPCGGLAIGFSWSHAMGDPHSAVNCFNKWSQLLQDMKTLRGKPNPLNKLENNKISAADNAPADVVPSSVKEAVESLGDTWVLPSSSQMATYSFQIKDNKLKQLQSREGLQVGDFELISALLWHTIAKVRTGKEVNTITLCKNNLSRSNTSLANEQSISSVKIDSSPSKLDISELAMAISKDAKNETQMVEAFVQGENGYKDMVVYGANLTFVDMLDLDLYGLTLKGQKPVNVEYAIDGVGEEGSVLVMQGNENDAKLVVLVLPENELHKVKEVLPMSVL
ncbi:protein ECERIFERUM 26-like protein [Carex littledalei]|uniref:Protein ECERIFERUM 26-like protein n=1 Tax=Carex littledalei TaxID=544730 RepID=A0A833QMI0_9POAL|nr:protein ECERIFERUM 26-like protein [Carex littledalei]